MGVGARIRVEFTDGDKQRVVHQRIGSGGSFGGNPFIAHIGLGGAMRVERLEIHWPTSGTTDRFSDVAVDRLVECREGSGKLIETRWKGVELSGEVGAVDRAGR